MGQKRLQLFPCLVQESSIGRRDAPPVNHKKLVQTAFEAVDNLFSFGGCNSGGFGVLGLLLLGRG